MSDLITQIEMELIRGLAVVVGLLITAGMTILFTKLNTVLGLKVSAEQQKTITQAADTTVHAVEQIAVSVVKTGKTVSSGEKKSMAMDMLTGDLKDIGIDILGKKAHIEIEGALDKYSHKIGKWINKL